VDFAKQAIDVGLYTDQLDASLAFWRDEVGLPYEELLKAGGGIHQHRLTLHGGVLKLNVSREPLAASPTGLTGLRIARAGVDSPVALRSPEGVAVELVPPGHDGVDAVEVRAVASRGGGRFRVGESIVAVDVDPDRPRTGPLRNRGFRYLTVQIRDLDAEHAALLARGFEEGTAPVRLGDVAYISFVRSRDGDWLELSQRRSLTGPLPDDVRTR